MSSDPSSSPSRVAHRAASPDESAAASRSWWDREAAAYLAEHGEFLGDAQLIWGPEGWSEEDLQVLGDPRDLKDRRVLEFGGGGAQGGRWVAAQGGQVVSSDLSAGMLAGARAIDARHDGPAPALLQADACRLPLASGCVDIAFSAYGALPFVADSAGLMRELARVLRPGGRLAISTTHPVRWAFPDAPGAEGLTAHNSYHDETPYVEETEDGRATYVEHHRTLSRRVADIIDAGLTIRELLEPEWPAWNQQTWGGWSPLRGHHLPGTLILVADKPAD